MYTFEMNSLDMTNPTMESPSKKTRVRVHGKLTVVSSKPVSPGRSHPLSSLDHAMANHAVRIVYYYPRRASKPNGPAVEFDPLRKSLCELLCLYPTLTGRLARDEDGSWRIRFNDAGVRVIQATVETTIDEWLRSADRDEEKDLTAWDELPDDPHIWPPFRIQLSEFKCGGGAVGLSFTHLISDPTTATFFFSSLSEFHRRQPLSHPPFIHSDALRRRPPSLTPLSSSPPIPTATPSSLSTATFIFSDDLVRKKLLSISPNSNPFNLLAALFWTAITKTPPQNPNNNEKPHSLMICVDFRKRLHAPLPWGYFGNALHFTRVESDGCELGHVAGEIGRRMEGINEEEVWEGVERFQVYGREVTCVNMEHLIGESGGGVMYTSDLGEECTPVHVSYDVEGVGEGLIWVMPSPEGGMARRVKVVLAKELLDKVYKDDVVRSFGPTLIISGPTHL